MAEIKPSYDTKRQKLSEIIPLDSPLSMYIEPTRTCNFKCFYCMHSTRGEKGGVLDPGSGWRIWKWNCMIKLCRKLCNLRRQSNGSAFRGWGIL